MEIRVPLSRGVQIWPFLDFLEGLGVRSETLLERHRLPEPVRQSPNTLISTRRMAELVGDAARRQGVMDLGWRATPPSLIQVPRLALMILGSPTLLRGLEAICLHAHRESSNARGWIEPCEDAIRVCVRGSVDDGEPGADQLCLMRTALLISVVRCFASPDWVPTECGMPIGVEPTPFVRSALRDARIQRSPGHVWIRLPSSMLALPPRTPARAPAGSEAFDEPALDLIESLVQAVRPYLPRGVPSIQLTAEIAGTSVRSLQRALASSGTCYRDVLLKLKLDTARALLRRPDIRIMDVAHEAGFTDHANFTRFFRYCAGMSPRAYRSAHLEGRR